MTQAKRVMVAMSGGVDSSSAAAILLEQGYRVEGLTMHLWRETSPGEAPEPDPAERARKVCQKLGIAHHVVDLRTAFYDQVVLHLASEYARGRTPNPCLRCNRLFKFGALLDLAREKGCDYLATGHYARISHDDAGWRLLCAEDLGKDQSYFLYRLGQKELRQILFPLGVWTKSQVRDMARALGLPAAEQAESQDICFLRDRDYRRFLADHLGETIRPGPIEDRQGRILGQHQGLAYYTVGQREGLGIAASRPYYVLALNPARNVVIVGHADELGQRTLLAEEMHYVAGRPLAAGEVVEAKIRYRARQAPARVWAESGGRARVVFDSSLRDIAPGQAIVLYHGQEVLGGGIIAMSIDDHPIVVDPIHAAR